MELDGEDLTDPRTVSAAELEHGVVLMLSERVVVLLHLADPVPEDPEATGDTLELVGASTAMARLRQQIRRVADVSVPVLVRGATGAGKELVARALHCSSHRPSGPLVAVNMAAVPSELAAAELFGAERGAFTGAQRRRAGHFQRADGGTLFLDEIGDIPSEVQTLLLRVLETREVQPLGSETPQRVDVRLIAATDAALEEAVEDGSFRAPLLHRLSGYVIEVPSLAKRRDDIGRLLYYFLDRELSALGDRLRDNCLPAPLVARIALYHWPGNVRQLRNAAREMVIESRGESTLRPGSQLHRWLTETQPSPRPGGSKQERPARYRKPSEITDEELEATLRAHRWRLRPAAADMGISRTSLYALIDKHPTLRTAAEIGDQELRNAVAQTGDIEDLVDAFEVSADGLRRRLRELDAK